MDNNPILLKSSMFGGYKKKDVLSYIFELNESTQESQQKFAEQIEELANSREALKHEVGELESRLAAIQADLDDVTSKLDEQTAKNAESETVIEKLKSDIAKHLQDLAEKSGEIQRVTSMNGELAEKNRKHEEKRGQVELAASQIAKLLSEARDDAGKVIEKAHDEAARIAAEAKRQADGIVAIAKASANGYINDANKTVNDIYTRFGDFCDELGGVQKTIDDLSSHMGARMEAINNVADRIKQKLPQSLELTDTELLSYDVEKIPVEEPVEEKAPAEVTKFAEEVLGHYGVRKDDSGFFRLAAERIPSKT